MSVVVLIRSSYGDCRRAVAQILDFFQLPVDGKTVLIKPNALRASEPEEGVCTHPAVVRALVEEIKLRGARRIYVGDNPGMSAYGSNEEAFRESGLLAAAGPHYVNLGARTRMVDLPPQWGVRVAVSELVLECDVLISVPKLKTHGLTGLTCALKNSYGFLPGAQKAELHRRAGNPFAFCELMVDVFAIRPPDLVLVDGILAMEGNGPVARTLRYLGVLAGARDAVALDRVMCHIMGIPLEQARSVTAAAERGLGEANIQRIQLIGELFTVEDFRLPPAYGPGAEPECLRAPRGADLGSRFDGILPRVQIELCDGCAACVKACPAGALDLRGGHPTVREEACIRCFCCQETCRTGALALRGN